MIKQGKQKETDDKLSNMTTGGECLIFDIIDEIRIAFRDDKEI
jgi:hypothetical protein